MQVGNIFKYFLPIPLAAVTITTNICFSEATMKPKKKICVVGCGIAGLTTAVFLAREGNEVVCFEACGKVAQESSFLNGSLICPSLTSPWSNPTTLRYVLSTCFPLLGKSTDLQTTIIDWKSVIFDVSFWHWLFHFMKSSIFERNVMDGYHASHQLSLFSKECMEQLYSAENGIEYTPGVAVGSLQIFGDESRRISSFRSTNPVVLGLQSISAEDLHRVEPALASHVGTGGAIVSYNDTSGDIEEYCQALRKHAEDLGVVFHMNATVNAASLESMRHSEVSDNYDIQKTRIIRYVNITSSIPRAASGAADTAQVTRWREYADVFVVASGNGANDLSEWAGDGVLHWPMKGYALEVPIGHSYRERDTRDGGSGLAKPLLQHLIADDLEKVYIAPLDNCRVRISGIVDVGPRSQFSCRSISVEPTPHTAEGDVSATEEEGRVTDTDRARAMRLLDKARQILPDGYLAPSNSPDIRIRVCYRPQTSDDLPVIGQSSHYSNLYYNCGHGHLGWTRATGSSRLLTDIIMQEQLGTASVDGMGFQMTIPQVPTAAHLPGVDCGVFSPSRFR